MSHSSSSGVPLGQNHPVNVIATGIDPHTTAQGVKIEPRNAAATVIAASSGQIEGSGELSRSCGKLSVTVPDKCSRMSTLRPVTTGRLSRLSHSGSRCVTKGTRVKLYGAGGDVVAHSSVPASQGLSPEGAPRVLLITTLISSSRKLANRTSAPAVERRLSGPHPISGRYV